MNDEHEALVEACIGEIKRRRLLGLRMEYEEERDRNTTLAILAVVRRELANPTKAMRDAFLRESIKPPNTEAERVLFAMLRASALFPKENTK